GNRGSPAGAGSQLRDAVRRQRRGCPGGESRHAAVRPYDRGYGGGGLMRHQAKGRQLSRTAEHRHALMRNMATSLILHGGIETNVARPRALRPSAEKLIPLARGGDLPARRLAAQMIRERTALTRLFTEIGPRFAARPGGYTRILKLGHRPGDGA